MSDPGVTTAVCGVKQREMSPQPPAAATPRRRVGFLFNHDQAHQVAHSLPVALALARAHPRLDVVLASTGPRISAEIRRLGGDGADGPPLVELDLRSWGARLAEAALGRLGPARKLLIYGDNLPFFAALDGLVVAEKTSLILKTRHGLRDLRIVHTRHGAGDRAIGFDRASAGFDLVLASGRKIAERLAAEAGVPPDRIRIVGYPKFDATAPRSPSPVFPEARPTVLYNPHASPRLSSWYRWGDRVLDRFAASRRFNLIFAPHVMLFERPLVLSLSPLAAALPGRALRRRRRVPHVHADTGSPASLDMTYTEAADIYLGDVSSQVYEFLRRPRPCVFLNAHGVRWEGAADYAHWRAGPVVDDLDRLEAALDEAVERHADTYAPVQRELFAYSFDLTSQPSAGRAAEAVAALLEPERAGGG